MNYENVKKCINNKISKYKVISFDIFDTLVKRDCSNPDRVFYMMQAELGKEFEDFVEIRKKAEQKCRENLKREEVLLDEIYEEMEIIFNKDCSKVKQLEIDYEIALCEKNPIIYETYLTAITQNKYVILVSDIYLDKNTIESILLKCGIQGYGAIYLSSEYFVRKSTGKLFDKVLDDLLKLKIIDNNKEILHIGDNYKSDFLLPMLKGCDTYHIKTWSPTTYFKSTSLKMTKEQLLSYKDLISFISNSENPEYSFLKKIGYECLGPILYGFVKWVEEDVEIRNIDKIFFLSRDGQIIKKAWDKLNNNRIETEYVYASRRAYIVPSLWMFDNVNEMLMTMTLPRIGNIDTIVKRLGLNPSNYNNVILDYGLQFNEYYDYQELFKSSNFNSFLSRIKNDIVTNSKKEYDILIKYLKSIFFYGNVAVVDIGWHGNMQKALKRLCEKAGIKVKIVGYYVGLNPEFLGLESDFNKETSNIYAKGYLFQKNFNANLYYYVKNFTNIFELFFTANHGTLIKFNEQLQPVFDDFEYDQNADSRNTFRDICDMQLAALEYVDNQLKKGRYFSKLDPIVNVANMIELGNYPNQEIAQQFGDMIVMDDIIVPIAKPKSIRYYFFHPKSFSNDYHLYMWKIGFFKRLLNINVPYYIMRVIYNYIKGSISQ